MQIIAALPDPDLMAPLAQHPFQAAALARIGVPAAMCVLGRGRGASGQALVIRRPLGGLVSRGPVWAAPPDPAQQTQALRLLAPRLVEAEGPDCPALRLAGFRMIITPAHMAEIDLTGTAADRLARAHPKWRAALRQAQAARLAVRDEPFDPARHGWFLAAEAAQRQARRYRALPLAIVAAWAALYPLCTRLAWVDGADGPQGGMLILRHGPVASYHIGWNGPAGRAARVHHLILATMADSLAADGVRRLDLGLVDTDQAASLARFKIGCGATVRPLGGSWLRLLPVTPG